MKKGIYDISFLKSYLKKNGISQKNLIISLNISQSYFCEMINGKKRLTQKQLIKILKFFNVKSYDELQELVKNDQNKMSEEIKKYKKRYDISFLKKYLKQKNISQTAISNHLNVSRQYVSALLFGQELITQKHLDKLLELFNVKSYDELQELVKSDSTDSIENLCVDHDIIKYDISFLKNYLKKNNISIPKLSNYLDIPYRQFLDDLKGKYKCDNNVINKLLGLFKVKNYDELKQLITYETSNLLIDDLLHSYDISFLKDYFYNNNIKYMNFCIMMGLDYRVCMNLLNGLRKLSCNNPFLYKLYDCFNVKSYTELKMMVNNNIVPTKLKEIGNKDVYDITCIKDYLEYNNISQSKLVKDTGLNYSTINSTLNGRIHLSNEKLNIIYKYFNVNNNSELEEYCYINGKKKYELLNYLIISEILSNKIENESLRNYFNNIKLNIDIDLNKLLEIVSSYEINSDYIDVILLIFNKKYNLSINEISLITNLSCEDITKILRDSINLYIEQNYREYYNEEKELKILIK